MQLPISLGNQGFASLRENHCFYIDKTDFIREWWEEQDVVTLITRFVSSKVRPLIFAKLSEITG